MASRIPCAACGIADGERNPVDACRMPVGESNPVAACGIADGERNPVDACRMPAGESNPVVLVGLLMVSGIQSVHAGDLLASRIPWCLWDC